MQRHTKQIDDNDMLKLNLSKRQKQVLLILYDEVHWDHEYSQFVTTIKCLKNKGLVIHHADYFKKKFPAYTLTKEGVLLAEILKRRKDEE